MSLFSFKPEARSLLSKIGKPRLFLFFGAIVVLILGNTLAANISLNSGGNVEFGQGVALTTACDNDVTVTPYSTFINEEGAGDFMFTSISVTGISEDCDGKIFTIKAYEEGSDDPLDLYITDGTDTYNSVQVSYSMSGDEGAFTLVDAGLLSDDIYDRERDEIEDSDGFTVELFTSDIPSSEALASARDVDRITIESRDGEEEVVVDVPIGDPEANQYLFARPTKRIGQSFVVPAGMSGNLVGLSELKFRCADWTAEANDSNLIVVKVYLNPNDDVYIGRSEESIVIPGANCDNSTVYSFDVTFENSGVPVLAGDSYYVELEFPTFDAVYPAHTYGVDSYADGDLFLPGDGDVMQTSVFLGGPTWVADLYFILNIT